MDVLAAYFPIILTAHISAVFTTLAIVVSSDIYGALWVIGIKETLEAKPIKILHDVVWVGLGIIMVTGFLLFLPYSDFLLTEFAFKLKMMFVVFLSINAFVIGKYMHIPLTRTFASMTWRERLPMLMSGAVSITGWAGAFIAAQFIGL